MTPDLSHSITLRPHPFGPSISSNSLLSPPSVENHVGQVPRANTGTGEPSTTKAVASVPSLDGADRDVESQTISRHDGPPRRPLDRSLDLDPFGLSSSYKTDSELAQIRSQLSSWSRLRNKGSTAGSSASVTESGPSEPTANPQLQHDPLIRSRSSCRPSFGLGLGLTARHRARRIKGFYRSQNAAIERMLTSVEEHRAQARQEQGEDHVRVQIAVYGSFVANVFLTGLQLYAAITSGSLSLFSTMADAVFDPLSNVTLILTSRAVRSVDPRRFPSGKARLETVGNIVFSFLMTAVAFVILAFACRELAVGGQGPLEFKLASVISVVAAFATKLVLFLYCSSLKDRHSQVRILWLDHRNDLLINAFGILTSVGGTKLKWWIDPAGAIVLSIVVSALWLRTAFEEFLLLVGVVASVATQQLITYICLTHSDAIRGIDTVRVYHSGPRLIVEVDIVMDQDASLKTTHDVAEALQSKLESLPDVERAYVHIDYETTHKPEHAWKKDL